MTGLLDVSSSIAEPHLVQGRSGESSRRVVRVFEAHRTCRGGVVGLGDSTHPTRTENQQPWMTAQPLTTLPPLGWSTWPAMYDESSEARNRKHFATSCGCPGRFIGTSLPKVSTFSAGNVDGIKGVQIGPGATALTRIPFSISAIDSDRVKATMAPFVLE